MKVKTFPILVHVTFSSEEDTIRILCRGEEVTLALGWGSYKPSWILNLLRDESLLIPLGLKWVPSQSQHFTQHPVSSSLGNKQSEKEQCPKPQNPLKNGQLGRRE